MANLPPGKHQIQRVERTERRSREPRDEYQVKVNELKSIAYVVMHEGWKEMNYINRYKVIHKRRHPTKLYFAPADENSVKQVVRICVKVV